MACCEIASWTSLYEYATVRSSRRRASSSASFAWFRLYFCARTFISRPRQSKMSHWPLRDGPTFVLKVHGFSPEDEDVTFEKLCVTDIPAFSVGAYVEKL